MILAQLAAPERSPADAALPAAAHRYTLDATLDTSVPAVRGKLRIRFTNTSQRPLEVLVFHLYLNAFADEDSVFMRESGGALRGVRFHGEGAMRLETLTVDGKDVLAASERELVPGDRTQLRAPLPEPLAPGERVEIESHFEVTLPPVFARSGYAQDFFAVAQWFPKLAVLEEDGRFESFPYHARGEFYADFADYMLTIRTPRSLQVVASGTLLDETVEDELVVRRFEAKMVHDVAFVAASGFQLLQETVDGVRVRYLAPPGYERALRGQARVVREGLRAFGRAFGRYPYGSLSVVLPPRDARGAAGMEYATLFISAAEWFALPGLPSLSGAFVAAHELAHQWFQGLVANDELRFPVLDEGLAQWAALDLMRTLYGAREGIFGLAFDRFEVERLLARLGTQSIAPGLPATAYSGAEYAASVYARAALTLESIRRAHGAPRFTQALRLYATRERFRHPVPTDLEQAFDAVYGSGFGGDVLRPLLFEGADSAVHIVEAHSQQSGALHRTTVRARRSGTVALPTAVAAYASDGREIARQSWPSDVDALIATLETGQPVARVVLDPDRAILLDPDVSDQIAEFTRPPTGALVARALGLLQALLTWLGP